MAERRGSEDSTSFIRRCLSLSWTSEGLPEVQAIAAQIDWPSFTAQVEAEALAPLLYKTLQSHRVLPAKLATRWQGFYHQNACYNTLLERSLLEFLQPMADRQIPVILLKGLALAIGVYGDLGVRPMSDIDLLIRPQDRPKTRQILQDLGYTLAVSALQHGYTDEFRQEETWIKTDRRLVIPIDLHWGLLNYLYYRHHLHLDWFWQTAQPLLLSGVPCLCLGPEAQILYLCAHLWLHHQGEGLLWQHDIQISLYHHQHQIRWPELFTQAAVNHLVLCLQQGLRSITDDRLMPTAILTQLQHLPVSLTERQLLGLLGSTRLSPSLRSFVADLLGSASWSERRRFLQQTLWPNADYMRQRYKIPVDHWLLPYYIYRCLGRLTPMK